MSKNLTLETRQLYQLGLVVIGLASLAVLVVTVSLVLRLLRPPKPTPALVIRQQQLENAVKLTFPAASR